MTAPAEPIFEPDAQATTQLPGETIDDGKGRIFPCEECGADLEFSIGQQVLQCPYCGRTKNLAPSESEIRENDLALALERLKAREPLTESTSGPSDVHEIRCESCGANVVFQGTLTSSTCPYCASPLQRDRVHDAETRVRVDAVLPFLVPRERAAQNLKNWIQTRWFAPNDFKELGGRGKFQGCYYPYYTYDSATFTRYSGERGDHYFVTEGHGKDQRTVQKTRWSSSSGAFDRFFDDVLVVAIKDEHVPLLQALEPWPLGQCHTFTQELLAGFFARTYDVPLDEGFRRARQRMDDALRGDILSRIGGDEQRIHQQKTAYNAITYKHVLLPVWLLAYRYHDKAYRVTVNAATGEVNGERPYSWIKITLAVLAAAAVVGTIVLLGQS